MAEYPNKQRRVDVQEEEDAVVIPYNGEQPLAVSSWQHRNLQRSQNGNDQLDYLPSETGHPTRQRGQNDGRVYNGTVVDGYGVVQQGDNHGTIQVNNYHTLAKPTKEEEEKRLFEILLGSLAKDLDMDARLRNVKIAMNQTCQWLFRHKHFRTWSSQDPLEEYNPFLRITGKPGCGKSTLMKTALTYVDEQWDQSWCTVSYFFNARATEELEKSSLGLYRSLVHQIVSKNSQLETGFRQAFRSKVKSDVVTAWAETELQNYLIDILRSDESLRLCLFIDALDEGSEDDVRDLVAFCEELVACAKEPQEAIRICMSSRHYPHFTFQRPLELVVEEESDHYHDIEVYVSRKLTVPRNTLASEAAELRRELCEKSSQIFLWVVLVIPMLNKICDKGGGLSAMTEFLRNTPDTLAGLFEEILDKSLHNIKECVVLLQWVLFSLQPLEPVELYLAVIYSNSPIIALFITKIRMS